MDDDGGLRPWALAALGKVAAVLYALVSIGCWSFSASVYAAWVKHRVFGIRPDSMSPSAARKRDMRGE